MRKIINKVTFLSMALLFTCSIAVAQMGGMGGMGAAPALPAEEQAAIYRNGVYQAINYKYGIINGMVRGTIEVDDAHFEKTAKDLAALSQMTKEGFTSGSKEFMGLTTAAVWEDQEDLFKLLDEFEVKASALAAVAGQGVEASTAEIDTLRQTCGACHRTYRARAGG